MALAKDPNSEVNYEEIKSRLEALEEENRSLQLQTSRNEGEELENGKLMFNLMLNDSSLKKERKIIIIKSRFENVEAEYNNLKAKCNVPSLFLKKNSIEKIGELKKQYESAVMKRNVGAAGHGASLVARFGAYLKNSDPALKLLLIGASIACHGYVKKQREELQKLSREMGKLLSEDFNRYKSFVFAAESLDAALRRHFGLSLYSMEFRRLCFAVSSASGEIAKDKKVVDFLQSLSQGLQDVLKEVTQNETLTNILKKLADDTKLANIRDAVSMNYVSLFFRLVPDLLDKVEPEAFLVPAQFFCEAILFCHENQMDRNLLGEVDANIERMKKEFGVMFELYEYCRAMDA